MDQREMSEVVARMQKVGLARCEACNSLVKFSEIHEYKGSLICAPCLQEVAWQDEGSIELPEAT